MPLHSSPSTYTPTKRREVPEWTPREDLPPGRELVAAVAVGRWRTSCETWRIPVRWVIASCLQP